MKKLIWASGLLLLLTVTACQNKHKQGSGNLEHKTLTDSSIVKIIPEYAQGFKITYTDQACLLDIQDPQNKESQSFHYALVPRGVEAENIPADYTVIETPIRSVICMTSLQLSNFIKLEELDAVVGITSTRHLFNKKINDRLKDGSIHKIGIEGNFDNEVIMSVNPDLILISPFKRGGYDALKEVGIPLMPHLGYKEMTPLGQAEWIKFVGLLLGREDKANEQFAAIKKRYNDLKELVGTFKKIYEDNEGKPFPQDPKDQLIEAVKAVFRSWDNPRANVYRKMNEIPYEWGTAVNVQQMAFGNSGDRSGTGVAFTRDPATGAKKLMGEYLINAQGEDVVAGVRTPSPISHLKDQMPEVYDQFVEIATRLENYFRDMQDMEFTIEDGHLYMLQTRNGKRTAQAALQIACDLVDEGKIGRAHV